MPAGLSIYQLLLAGIALAFITSGAVRFFRGAYRQTLIRFLMVSGLWAGVLVFSLFPRVSHVASVWFGFGENLNTLIFTGFVLVFIALFKLLSAVERLEQNITEIVRKEALSVLPTSAHSTPPCISGSASATAADQATSSAAAFLPPRQ